MTSRHPALRLPVAHACQSFVMIDWFFWVIALTKPPESTVGVSTGMF